jgi:hypothetical protein
MMGSQACLLSSRGAYITRAFMVGDRVLHTLYRAVTLWDFGTRAAVQRQEA